MVMYLGRAVEQGPPDNAFRSPRHPCTKALLSAKPKPDLKRKRERIVLNGEMPSPIDPPTGCTFHPRCPSCFESCPAIKPSLLEHEGSLVACHAVNPPEAETKVA